MPRAPRQAPGKLKRMSTTLPLGTLPPAEEMSGALRKKISEVGELWAQSPLRPVISTATCRHWDSLIAEWSDSDLPLVIRKSSSGVRGERLTHESGRAIVVADNSPAQWAFRRAYAGELYSIDDIRRHFSEDKIPFAFATKSAEKSRTSYRCTLTACDSVNKLGWKLCHVKAVRLGTKGPLLGVELSALRDCFRRLLSPSNHFPVPLAWAGLGEVPEFIEQICNFDNQRRHDVALERTKGAG